MERKKINIPKITIHLMVTITQWTPPPPPSSFPTPACRGILKYFGGVRTPHTPLWIHLCLQTFGTCSFLHTDSGSQFTSSIFKEYCKFLGIAHRLSNIRYPQSNGLCERYIKTIKTALTAK